jgi:hypothetical protein
MAARGFVFVVTSFMFLAGDVFCFAAMENQNCGYVG